MKISIFGKCIFINIYVYKCKWILSLYKEKCSELNILLIKEHMYRHIFNTCFNLHFKIRKDICKRCDKYRIKLDAESSDQEIIKKLEDKYELHL